MAECAFFAGSATTPRNVHAGSTTTALARRTVATLSVSVAESAEFALYTSGGATIFQIGPVAGGKAREADSVVFGAFGTGVEAFVG